jgi:hypothetical protein
MLCRVENVYVYEYKNLMTYSPYKRVVEVRISSGIQPAVFRRVTGGQYIS